MLRNKKIIVTAGCSGIGAEFTKLLLEKGATVFPTTRNIYELDYSNEILRHKQCKPYEFNAKNNKDVDGFVGLLEKNEGEIYALINCAACRDVIRDPAETDMNEWQKHYFSNVFLPTALSVSVADRLIKKNGCIVNMSSFYSITIPDNRVYDEQTIPATMIYASSKASLNYITKYLAVKYAANSIRVNAILPAGVRNPDRQSDFFVSEYCIRTPMGRMAEINEFNEALLFLLAPANTFYTGQLLTIDGGWSLL